MRGISYERVWAMPNHHTFNIKPIRNFIKHWSFGKTLDIFPFEGKVDALDVMRGVKENSVDTVLYDPVYSQRQQNEMYSGWGKNYNDHPTYFNAVEREIARVVRHGGRCLKFMWNSKSLPGFDVVGGILVAHGGQHHDTICTAYERRQTTLDGEAK